MASEKIRKVVEMSGLSFDVRVGGGTVGVKHGRLRAWVQGSGVGSGLFSVRCIFFSLYMQRSIFRFAWSGM